MAPRSDVFFFEDSDVIEFKPRVGSWAPCDGWLHAKFLEDSTCSGEGRVRRQKMVRFSNQEKRAQEYIHVSEYSPEEKRACWYDQDDYVSMRQHDAETLYKMNQQLPLLAEEESQVGLETRTSTENAMCRQQMRNAMFAVLYEQDEQWRLDGCLNHEILAARYMSYTWEARDRARYIGQAHRDFQS